MPPGWEQCVAAASGKKEEFEDPHILYRSPAQHALQEVRSSAARGRYWLRD